MYIIYKLTSPSGKSYVGYTSKSLEIRFRQHVHNYNSWLNGHGKNGSIKLFCAFKAYKPENFIKEIIAQFKNKKEALLYEVDMIKKYNSMKEGYNIASGGDGGMCGKTHSEATKQKMSKSRTGKKASEEAKRNMSKAQQNRSEETKKKMSIAKQNMSEETRQKIGASKMKAVVNSDGVVFASISEAIKYYNVVYSTLIKWIKLNKFGLRYY